MNLSDVRRAKIPRKKKFPVGRGHSSGLGKQCGKGKKGQYVRQGTSFRPSFEGGQMPMLRRLPKYGFNNNAFRLLYEEVNVGQLNDAFGAGEAVDEAALRAKGLVKRTCDAIVILGGGTLTKKLAVKAHRVTDAAEAKIVKAGGSVERLFKKKAPKAPPPKPAAPAAGQKPKAEGERKPGGQAKPQGEKKPPGPPPAEKKPENPAPPAS
jgi:large subunit ribosomal protein L15